MPIGEPWTDHELEAALEAYLYALRLEHVGVRIPENGLIEGLQWGPLRQRNAASIRYRLRNISSVLQKVGFATISAYPPATKVGTGVESRLRAMLPSAAFGSALTLNDKRSTKFARSQAIDALDSLATALRALDTHAVGFGHNNPPEEIEPGTLRGDLRRTLAAVEDLKDELGSKRAREETVRSKTLEIAQSGASWAAWFGARGTTAVDAAIKTIVPAALLGLAALALKAVIALAPLVVWAH